MPKLTKEERLRNLELAMAARRARVELKALMKSGGISLADALNDSRARRMRVKEFLTSLPGVGDKKAEAIMLALGIASNRRIAGLGSAQRAALAAAESDGWGNLLTKRPRV